MNFYTPPKEKVGDLYWRQLSMWDFSDKENIDVYSHDGFHYELFVVKEIITDTSKKVRNVKAGELTTKQIENLIPEKGHNWSRVMGNDLTLITSK